MKRYFSKILIKIFGLHHPFLEDLSIIKKLDLYESSIPYGTYNSLSFLLIRQELKDPFWENIFENDLWLIDHDIKDHEKNKGTI